MYSQAKVIAGGLAHIPVVIAVFYFILTTFNKRALKFVEETKTKKTESKAVEPKKPTVSKVENLKTEAPKAEIPKVVKKKHADVPVNIYCFYQYSYTGLIFYLIKISLYEQSSRINESLYEQ